MGRDQETLACMHMHTFSRFYLYQLERTNPLDLHQLILQDAIGNRLHEQPQKAFRLLTSTPGALR